jgi:predicted unusual protein kinase regulating ubiquinone biosynthesis (AarF/ABC1/UbiB family)
VHLARLRDGRVVALKIQRPGIARIIQTDLRTLRFVLDVVRRLAPGANQFIDLRQLYQEFSRTVNEELDYQREGRNAERFARIFADDPMIGVPGVLWEYSTRRVLVLEWMDGIKITRFAELDAAGVDRGALAKRLAGASHCAGGGILPRRPTSRQFARPARPAAAPGSSSWISA